jgi:hypothetical protein
MTLKEKLDLLWKYLLLIVLVYGFAQIGRSHSRRFFKSDVSMGMPHHEVMWKTDDCDARAMKNVEVHIEKHGDGDSTMVVTINGEEVDIDDVELSKFEKGDSKVFIKKIVKSDDMDRKKMIKMKKEMVEMRKERKIKDK